jgi:hypothetical protein
MARRAKNFWLFANDLVDRIHDRMPLILAPGDYARWLSDKSGPRELMRPFPTSGPLKHKVNRVWIQRAFGAARFKSHQLDLQFVRQSGDDLVLHVEEVGNPLVETLGPKMREGLGLDQLHVDAHPVTAALDAALERVAHIELAPDLADVDCLPLGGEGGIAGDDQSPPNARKIRGQAFGDAVDEIFLLGAAADIGEVQDDQGETR